MSELFTVLYAVELLMLCGRDQSLDVKTRRACTAARDRAFAWLAQNRNPRGLWQSGVLTQTWDELLSTSWVLHRLAPLSQDCPLEWQDILEAALGTTLRYAHSAEYWGNTELHERRRVEARIAAAAVRSGTAIELEAGTQELVAYFLAAWRTGCVAWLTALPDNALDVATVTFLLKALYPREILAQAASEMGGEPITDSR